MVSQHSRASDSILVCSFFRGHPATPCVVELRARRQGERGVVGWKWGPPGQSKICTRLTQRLLFQGSKCLLRVVGRVVPGSLRSNDMPIHTPVFQSEIPDAWVLAERDIMEPPRGGCQAKRCSQMLHEFISTCYDLWMAFGISTNNHVRCHTMQPPPASRLSGKRPIGGADGPSLPSQCHLSFAASSG